jgi:hypothetical protein
MDTPDKNKYIFTVEIFHIQIQFLCFLLYPCNVINHFLTSFMLLDSS